MKHLISSNLDNILTFDIGQDMSYAKSVYDQIQKNYCAKKSGSALEECKLIVASKFLNIIGEESPAYAQYAFDLSTDSAYLSKFTRPDDRSNGLKEEMELFEHITRVF